MQDDFRLPISATTKLLGVVGDPISHSLSPEIHNAAILELGIDYAYLAFRVPSASLGRAIEGVRGLGIRGLSVTMPHKADIGQYLDSVSEDAKALNSVNAVYWDETTARLCGTSTDGVGFIDGLKSECSFDIKGKVVGVIGAGGAARSIVLALVHQEVEEVQVLGRSQSKLEQTVAIGGDRCVAATVESLRDCDLIVNATPVGMSGRNDFGGLPVPTWVLREEMLVCDIVYTPLVTELMKVAAAKGCRTVGGLPMLLHQAAHAFRLFTGFDPPYEAMRRAVRARLNG